jgi:Tellurite resistance protein TerB
MGTILILISVLLAASAAVVFSGLVDGPRLTLLARQLRQTARAAFSELGESLGRFKPSNSLTHTRSGILTDTGCGSNPEAPAPIDIRILNCRVLLKKLKGDNGVSDALGVEICGSIHAASEGCRAALNVSVLDVTDGRGLPVQAQIKPATAVTGPTMAPFCHKAELGKLPNQVTILPDWTGVGQFSLEGLLLPRKGNRTLQIETSILSAKSGLELAHAYCTFAYDNPTFGYMDLQEHAERTKVLAVALAFAVSAADGHLYDCEIELIKNWARDNILDNPGQGSEEDARKLDKALSKTIAFFSAGNSLDVCGICREIVGIAPVAQRYDILELCLYVARASGSVTGGELTLLKSLAGWFEVDAERFRAMMEKVLPIDMHQVRDVETVLGITSGMDNQAVRHHLNKEYSKWNARVTNSDPGIQTQADQMLKLIAEARSQYTSEQAVSQKDAKVPAR